MSARSALAIMSLALVPSLVLAQHGGGSGPDLSTVAPKEAAQFDFLVGLWELDVKPVINTLAAKIHGVPKFAGTWKAWKSLDGWGMVDELRITDASGNPRTFAHAVRIYDPTARRWSTQNLDVYRSVFTASTGEWKGSEMIVTSRNTDKDGKAYISRGRYYDITPQAFKFDQDRSFDEGKTWDGNLRVLAKRVAASATR